jgi:hypothetical protein
MTKRTPIPKGFPVVARDVLLSIIFFALPQGWSMSGFPPNILWACVFWLLGAIAAGHAFWRWAENWSPFWKALIIVVTSATVIVLMVKPTMAEYRREFVYDTFPFLSPHWNSREHTWVFILDGRGSRSMHDVGVALTDINAAMSYLAPGPESSGPGLPLHEIEPSEKWLHRLQVAELIPGGQSGGLITVGPTSDQVSNFAATMSADGVVYGEYLKLAQEGSNWKAAVRVVDITHHLNLIHCHAPELFIEPYRPLKNDGLCAGGYQTDVFPWESWQKVEDKYGNSPY